MRETSPKKRVSLPLTTPDELRLMKEELEYLKRIVNGLESWSLQLAAKARISWIEGELKRLERV
jgi:hypothetical protein